MPEEREDRFIPFPNMDPRMLAVFMLLTTQDGYAADLLPLDGSEPNYDDPEKNHFKRFGLEKDIQQRFWTLFSRNDKVRPELENEIKKLTEATTQRDVHRQLFVTVALSLRLSEPAYHPPACPSPETLKAVIALLNGYAEVVSDTLLRYGLE